MRALYLGVAALAALLGCSASSNGVVDGGAVADAPVDAPSQDNPTTWRITRNPTPGIDQVMQIDATSTYAFILGGYDPDAFVEARRMNDGSRAWRVEVPDGALLRSWEDDVLVVTQPPGTVDSLFERRRAEDGSVAWSKTMRSRISAVDVNTEGLFGVFRTVISGSDTGWIVGRYNVETGDAAWEKTSNPSSYEDGPSALRATDQNVYISGVRKNGGPPYSTWHVEKRDIITGDVVWATPFTLAAVQTNNAASSIDSDDVGVYVTGYMVMDAGDGAGVTEHTVVVRLDASTGEEVWHTTIPFGANDIGRGRWPQLTLDDDAVYVTDPNRDDDTILAKLAKEDGAVLWSATSFRQRVPFPVAVTLHSGYILIAGRAEVPDAADVSETQIYIEKRFADTGTFSDTDHVEISE